jgi:phytoene dehydrogenase-like protein
LSGLAWWWGRTSAIAAKGFKFDLGPTFFLFPRVLEEIFAAAGASLCNEVEMVRLDPHYRITFGAGGEIDATAEVSRMRYGSQIDIDGVADVSMVPKPLHAVVRALFRKRLTHSVMLDWDGSVVKRFEYKRGVANLYVIDRSGIILKRITGPLNASLERELFRTIDGAIADNPTR